MSAVLAGYCLFRFCNNSAGNLLIVPYLLAGGALLGMADNAWRLIFTAAAEHEKFPDDLPAGTVTTTASYFIAVFTTIGGLMCTMTAGYDSFRAAGVLILVTMAKSALFRKTEVITPLLKGLSFGLFYILGTTAHTTFSDILEVSETRIPVAFFVFYMVIAGVLSQVRDSAKPRAAPPDEELSSVTASRLLEMRDEAIDGSVAWFAGGALVAIPVVLAWIMPFQWLSWFILAFLSLSTLTRLIPVLVYRTRRDLMGFIESIYRGGALLNAGAVASLSVYTATEIYEGVTIPMPGRDQLAGIVAIALLATPAWFLRRVAPVD